MTTSWHPIRTALRWPQIVFAATGLVLALLSLNVTGCRSRKSPAHSSPSMSVTAPASGISAGDQVLLTGTFERVSRAVSGSAAILRRGNDYKLKLSGVTVAQTGDVHVFLVGHERAATTRIVDDTEMKYDMAKLELGVPEQTIELPSQPDEALRSVVLFYPTFGVNLAVAPLRPPVKAP